MGLPFLHHALRWLGVATSDMDDLLQEVFLAAYCGLPSYEPWRYHAAPANELPAAGLPPLRVTPETALQRWLFGIAWRKASHYHARAHRRREIPSGAGGSWPFEGRDPAPTPEHTLASADRAEVVTALLLKIAPERRVILVMYDLLGVPVADIARELQLKENTVRSRLRLAREDFRAAVARQPAERRSALSGLPASERSLDAAAASLLRAARALPPVPADLARDVWLRLQHHLQAEQGREPRRGVLGVLGGLGKELGARATPALELGKRKSRAVSRAGLLTIPHVCVVCRPLAEKAQEHGQYPEVECPSASRMARHPAQEEAPEALPEGADRPARCRAAQGRQAEAGAG
ncbi:RNA polymerase sigma factor [Sorangium sp. So ce131]|uniref:RNA polymerase sigma factor n=1 Tax=Sorangium sp. So ce131 TaxID=3133282 RepID=UPI003F60548C